MIFSCVLIQIEGPVLADQRRFTYMSSVRILDAMKRTYSEWWLRGTDSEKSQGILTRGLLLSLLFVCFFFSYQRQLMVFHWSLSDSKFPQVSRTLLSILAVRNNVVVQMVSTRPPASKSSMPFNNPLVTIPNKPITINNCHLHVP